MKNKPSFIDAPLLARTRPPLVVFQKQLETASQYLYRHSGRYGFCPEAGQGIAGYVERNTLYLAINQARHIAFSLNRGAEPRVMQGALDIEKIKRPDAYVWVFQNAPAPLEKILDGPKPFSSSHSLHARMAGIRVRTNQETIGTAFNMRATREFTHETARLSIDVVQFRV